MAHVGANNVLMKGSVERIRTRGHTGNAKTKLFRQIPVVQVHIDNNADHSESSLCNIGTKAGNYKKKFSNKDCLIMGDKNYGNIRWGSLERTKAGVQEFMTEDRFLIQLMPCDGQGQNKCS